MNHRTARPHTTSMMVTGAAVSVAVTVVTMNVRNDVVAGVDDDDGCDGVEHDRSSSCN